MAEYGEFAPGDRAVKPPDAKRVDDTEHFDYNETVLVESSMRDSRSHVVEPTGGPRQPGPLTLEIEPQTNRYICLNKARLEIRARVVRGDGNQMHLLQDIVAPINGFGAALWKNIDVSLNGTLLPPSATDGIAHKFYMETMLTNHSSSLDNHLHAMMFDLDTPGEMENYRISRRTAKLALKRAIRAGQVTGFQWPAGTEVLEPPDPPPGQPQTRAEWGDPFYGMEEVKEPDTWIPVHLTGHDKDQREHFRQRWLHFERTFNRFLVEKNLIDFVAIGDDYNKGFDKRFRAVQGSDDFDTMSPIHHNVFNMSNHIGPGVRVVIKLTKHTDEFLLNTYFTGNRYKVELLEVKLHFDTIGLKDRCQPGPVENYRINETHLKTGLVHSGSPETTIKLNSYAVLPKTVIVALSKTSAFDGSYADNPWAFNHFNVKEMYLVINGERVPRDSLKFDFSRQGAGNCLVARSYSYVFDNSGNSEMTRGNLITPDAYVGGYLINVFDLTPDKCNSEHNHDAAHGYIELKIIFDSPPEKPLNAIVETIYPRMLKIEKTFHNVTLFDVQS